MGSLTDLWKAAGSNQNQKPVIWIRHDDAQRFVKEVGKREKVTGDHLFFIKAGCKGGTFAHWQIALAYAKYLSPEMHMAANAVFRGYVNADPAMAASIDDWKAAPGVVMETVKAAKTFIEAELGKYGTWEEFRSYAGVGPISSLIPNGQTFSNVKGKGVGIETIHAFLGGQWKRHYIQDTLSVIRQEEDAERKRIDAYEAAQRAKEERERRQAAEVIPLA